MAIDKTGKMNSYYPPPVQKKTEDQFREAAGMYEKTFLKEMVKAMRTTVPEGGFIQASHGEKIFKDELDNEYVDQWAKKGGIGIADMIYDQLMQKYGGQNMKVKPQGPLDLKDAGTFKGAPSAQKKDGIDFTFSRAVAPKDSAENSTSADKSASSVVGIQSPWNGTLTDKTPVANGYLLKIDHDNGLSSQLHFRGTASGMEKGQKIQAGQRVGLLSPDANEFFWSLGERIPGATEEFGEPAPL